MPDAEEILNRWKVRTPGEDICNNVIKFVNAYSQWRPATTGSHIIVTAPRVAAFLEQSKKLGTSELPPFNYMGEFSVHPYKGPVKKVTLLDIIKAIKLLEELEEIDEKGF